MRAAVITNNATNINWSWIRIAGVEKECVTHCKYKYCWWLQWEYTRVRKDSLQYSTSPNPILQICNSQHLTMFYYSTVHSSKHLTMCCYSTVRSSQRLIISYYSTVCDSQHLTMSYSSILCSSQHLIMSYSSTLCSSQHLTMSYSLTLCNSPPPLTLSNSTIARQLGQMMLTLSIS